MPLYIGVDFHPHQQTVCWCDLETGEIRTRTIFHNTAELTKFYRAMPASIVGIEATSKATWFEQLLFDNHHQLIVGNPNVIRKRAVSRHKNDNRDAQLIFDLLTRGDTKSAAYTDAGSLRSLLTSSTPFSAHFAALSRSRTSARNLTPFSSKAFAVAPPLLPVIPVSKIMSLFP